MTRRFMDRTEAGTELAGVLARYRASPTAVVLALPRGGVPVGYEVASALGLPLDVLVVRKLGMPSQPELAMGAVASGGAVVLNDESCGTCRGAATRWSRSFRANCRNWPGAKSPTAAIGRRCG